MRTGAVWSGRIFTGLWPPLLFGLGFLALWEAFVVLRDVEPFVLPKPTAIFEQLRENLDTILEATWATGQNALVGLALGLARGPARRAAGVAAARRWRSCSTPLAGRRGRDPDRGADARS